jgi:hypothetical protein
VTQVALHDGGHRLADALDPQEQLAAHEDSACHSEHAQKGHRGDQPPGEAAFQGHDEG